MPILCKDLGYSDINFYLYVTHLKRFHKVIIILISFTDLGQALICETSVCDDVEWKFLVHSNSTLKNELG